MNDFFDDYLDDETQYKDFDTGFSFNRPSYLESQYNDIHDFHENFGNPLNPLLCQSTINCKSEDNGLSFNENMEHEEFLNNEASQLSGDDNFEFNNSSSSGAMSPNGTESQPLIEILNDKRNFSNEMERQRRKQYSESLKKVQEILPEEYIKRARDSLGRKNMKKVSYQVLLHGLCTYLKDDANKNADVDEAKRHLKVLTNDIKTQFKAKSHLIDDNFKATIGQFIQQANNLLCTK